MAFTHKKRLERFIRQQAFGSNWEEPLERFVIEHARGSRGTTVLERRIGDDDRITLDNLDRWVDEIMDVMEGDAVGMGGLQRYLVKAYREGCENHSGRAAFRIQGEDVDEENDEMDELDYEGANGKGLVSQSMRHSEAYAKILSQSLGSAIQNLTRMNHQQQEHIERLLEQRFKTVEIVEEAMTRKHEREMEMMMEGSAQERKDQIVEKTIGLLPAVVNRIGGKKLLPEPVTPREEMLKSLVSSLRPEQFEKVASILDPDQTIGLVELIQAYKNDEDAKADSSRNGKT